MLDTLSMAEKLKGDYRKVFEKADMYSILSSENEEAGDEKMMNLYDLLLEAQSNEKPVEKIVGTDIETFCKDYFKVEQDAKEKKYITYFNVLYTMSIWITVITLIWVIFPEEGETIQSMTINILPFFAGVCIGSLETIIMRYVLEPLIFKSKKIKPITFSIIILLSFLGSVILATILFSDVEIMNIPALWLLIGCGGYVVIYLLVRSLWRYHTYGTIRKDTKENRERKKAEKKIKKAFNDEVSMKSLAKPMAKRYARLNKRKLRRKHEEFTFAEFAELIRKEERLSGKIYIIMAISLAVFVIFSTVMEMITTGFIFGLVLGIIMAIIEAGIFRFFQSCNDTGMKQQIQIIDECERLGITITEYANNESLQ